MHLGYQFLVQGWLRGVGYLHLIECPVGFDHNGTIHLATYPILQKILSPDLHSDFPKCENVPNTESSYSLILWWRLSLYNTSLDAKFSVENFSFCWSVKSMSSSVSLHWGKFPKYTEWCAIQPTVSKRKGNCHHINFVWIFFLTWWVTGH